jgi:ABC-type antimicrobial peptide transport system permease subunit
LLLMRLVQSFLFGTGPGDPLVLGSATVVFLGAALAAGGLPALRAARLDPLVALRQD